MDARSQKTLAIALLGAVLAFVVLVVVGGAYGVHRIVEQQKASAALRGEMLELQKRALAKTKDGLPVPDEEIDAMLATLREQADRAGAGDAGLYRCGAEMIALHARGGRALQQKLREMDTLLVAKDADRPGELDRRLRILGEFETLNQQVIGRLEGMPAAAERCLAKHHVADAMRKGFMSGMNRTPSARTAQLQIRRIDIEFVAAARDELAWVKSIQPRYRYDATRNVLVFERTDDLSQYQARSEKIQAIAARSEQAGRTLVAAIESSIAYQSQ